MRRSRRPLLLLIALLVACAAGVAALLTTGGQERPAERVVTQAPRAGRAPAVVTRVAGRMRELDRLRVTSRVGDQVTVSEVDERAGTFVMRDGRGVVQSWVRGSRQLTRQGRCYQEGSATAPQAETLWGSVLPQAAVGLSYGPARGRSLNWTLADSTGQVTFDAAGLLAEAQIGSGPGAIRYEFGYPERISITRAPGPRCGG